MTLSADGTGLLGRRSRTARTLPPIILFARAGDLVYDAARGSWLSAASRKRGDVLREAARGDARGSMDRRDFLRLGIL